MRSVQYYWTPIGPYYDCDWYTVLVWYQVVPTSNIIGFMYRSHTDIPMPPKCEPKKTQDQYLVPGTASTRYNNMSPLTDDDDVNILV